MVIGSAYLVAGSYNNTEAINEEGKQSTESATNGEHMQREPVDMEANPLHQ